MESETPCSKCKVNPPSKGNPWCQPCRTDHARRQRELEFEMIGARNWQAGANAIRYAIAHELAKRPGCQIECLSTAEWIMGFSVPEFTASVKSVATGEGIKDLAGYDELRAVRSGIA